MKYNVYILSDAEEDLFDIYQYVVLSDSPLKAERLIQKLKDLCVRLEEYPDRGHVPPELATIGVYDYQKIHCKPYRVIYQVVGKDVFIHCVLDGRRDMQELLQHRLLR